MGCIITEAEVDNKDDFRIAIRRDWTTCGVPGSGVDISQHRYYISSLNDIANGEKIDLRELIYNNLAEGLVYIITDGNVDIATRSRDWILLDEQEQHTLELGRGKVSGYVMKNYTDVDGVVRLNNSSRQLLQGIWDLDKSIFITADVVLELMSVIENIINKDKMILFNYNDGTGKVLSKGEEVSWVSRTDILRNIEKASIIRYYKNKKLVIKANAREEMFGINKDNSICLIDQNIISARIV